MTGNSKLPLLILRPTRSACHSLGFWPRNQLNAQTKLLITININDLQIVETAWLDFALTPILSFHFVVFEVLHLCEHSNQFTRMIQNIKNT